jgi:hypothetical protein
MRVLREHAWRFSFVLCAGVLATRASAEPFTGKVYRAGEPHHQPVFTLERLEKPQPDGSLRVTGRYFAVKDGSPAMLDDTLLVGGQLRKYTLQQNQIQEWGTLEVLPDKIHFEWSRGRELLKNDEDRPSQLVVGSTTIDFLKAHWPEILAGEDVTFRFGVLGRQETVGFKFFKTQEVKLRGTDAVVVRMKPTSIFVNAKVDPIYFTLEKSTTRLLELKGKIGLRERDEKSWKDFDSEIEYFYADGKPVPTPQSGR